LRTLSESRKTARVNLIIMEELDVYMISERGSLLR